MTQPHITFILNPAAGRGKAQHIYTALRSALEHSTLNYTFHLTTGPDHATALAREASAGSSIVVAIGGDGTVNEVASGLIGANASLAVMSEGSGNDFARIIDAPNDIQGLLSRIQNPAIATFDAGLIAMTHADGTTTVKNFFNSVGLGFDAAVAKKVSSIRWLRGIPLYLSALLHTLVGYRPHFLTVHCNNEQWQKNYFLLCIGNGKWEGGGFMLTPHAVPDDGKFEVCGVTGDSILKVLPILPSVMTGTHLGKRYIESFDTTAMTVQSSIGFPVHGDGEIFGLRVILAEISINPAALKVVVPHRQ
ncbi:MAG: diacylglycerol kinase family protein [Bacteriovoracaceae bacterium]|nr:diacylglycerol kinase family lipid kinase [Bacteroidota bacterium]